MGGQATITGVAAGITGGGPNVPGTAAYPEAYGAGGSGAWKAATSGATLPGGSGAPGVVIVEW